MFFLFYALKANILFSEKWARQNIRKIQFNCWKSHSVYSKFLFIFVYSKYFKLWIETFYDITLNRNKSICRKVIRNLDIDKRDYQSFFRCCLDGAFDRFTFDKAILSLCKGSCELNRFLSSRNAKILTSK